MVGFLKKLNNKNQDKTALKPICSLFIFELWELLLSPHRIPYLSQVSLTLFDIKYLLYAGFKPVAAVMEARRFYFLPEDVESEEREVKMTQLSVISRPQRGEAVE